MTNPGERAYAHAKACGIIGRSFVGKRIAGLEKATRLSELDRIIFPGSFANLPERELLFDLENRIEERTANSVLTIVRGFSRPPEFLVLLLRAYEYTDLKNAAISIMEKGESPPPHTDLGRFQTVNFDAWPDIRKMVEGTTYSFILPLKKNNPNTQNEIIALESVLDRHYYNALWRSLHSLPVHERHVSQKILSDEISLKNSSLALRLRHYYNMKADEVKTHLVDIKAEDAIKSLEYPLDSFHEWSTWHWKHFLNHEVSGSHWHASPRFFQNAASRDLYHLARHYFFSGSTSLDTIFCFIKLKQFEEDILTGVAEGLGIGMTPKDVFNTMGLHS
jgi:vacuolar-type H+-ATPase subunit C/Vma6